MDVCDPGEIHTSFHPHLSSPMATFGPKLPPHHSTLVTDRLVCLDLMIPQVGSYSDVHKCKVYNLQNDIRISAASYNIMTLLFTQCLHPFCCEAVWETNASSKSERAAIVHCSSQVLNSLVWDRLSVLLCGHHHKNTCECGCTSVCVTVPESGCKMDQVHLQ